MGRKKKEKIEEGIVKESEETPRFFPNGELMGTGLVLTPEPEPEKDEFDIKAASLESEIEKKYKSEMVELFKQLAYEITVIGMQLQEACVIVGIEYEKLVIMMQNDPLIERLIRTKDLEYKRKLLKTVSIKAKTDDKLAMGLLQARYPDEFNPRKGSARGEGEGGNEDILGMAIEFIQKSGDNTPLVTEKSGKITIVKRTSSENADLVKKMEGFLK